MEKAAGEELHCAVFWIEEFKDKKIRFKVEKNAIDWHFKGVCISNDSIRTEKGTLANLVIVEGGKVAVWRYKKLLLWRIKWREEEQKESSSESDSEEETKQDSI